MAGNVFSRALLHTRQAHQRSRTFALARCTESSKVASDQVSLAFFGAAQAPYTCSPIVWVISLGVPQVVSRERRLDLTQFEPTDLCSRSKRTQLGLHRFQGCESSNRQQWSCDKDQHHIESTNQSNLQEMSAKVRSSSWGRKT